MKAEILTIGTELLIGQVVNTNATYLARELAELGIDLHYVTTVGDNPSRIADTMRQAWERADVVLCTGGLGPTADDLTHEMVAQVLGLSMRFRPEIYERIEAEFARNGRRLTGMERKLATYPEPAELMRNPAGTASGVWVEREGKYLLTFPGIPHELEQMWSSEARPRLQRLSGDSIRSRLLKFVGITEADVAESVSDLLEGSNPTVAPYAGSGEVHLRVTAKGATANEAEAMLGPVVDEILRRMDRWYFGSGEQTLPGVLGAMLRERAETLSVAESCTAGLLASRMTDVSGSSDYFVGGAIVYTPHEKGRALGIDPELLARAGHVSEEVTRAMADAVRRLTGTTWGIGITGYAGGGPNTPLEQIGQIYIAISGAGGTESQSFRFGRHPRDRVKWFATQRALALLLEHLRQPTRIKSS